MNSIKTEHLSNYAPDVLLEVLKEGLKVKNDKQLAVKLNFSPSVISKVRNRVTPITATQLLRMHEVSGVPVNELRTAMGDLRPVFSTFLLNQPT